MVMVVGSTRMSSGGINSSSIRMINVYPPRRIDMGGEGEVLIV